MLEYIAAAFAATPILSQLVASRTADTLTLTNRVSIEVRSASFRRLRGPTYLAVISDEAAFWHSDESANPDVEILNAVRPGLATTNGLLAIISSPYARRGVVWDAWRSHYGPAGDPLILVAHGASRTFNPSLPQSVVDRALDRERRRRRPSTSRNSAPMLRASFPAKPLRRALRLAFARGRRCRMPITWLSSILLAAAPTA